MLNSIVDANEFWKWVDNVFDIVGKKLKIIYVSHIYVSQSPCIRVLQVYKFSNILNSIYVITYGCYSTTFYY